MKHVRAISRKPEVAQRTVFQVKLDAIVYFVGTGAEYFFGKWGHSVV
jgi:hypothetical protein